MCQHLHECGSRHEVPVVAGEIVAEGTAAEGGGDKEIIPVERALAELEAADNEGEQSHRTQPGGEPAGCGAGRAVW